MIKIIKTSLSWCVLLLLPGIVSLTGCGGGGGVGDVVSDSIGGISDSIGNGSANLLPFGEGGSSGTGVLAASVSKGTISGFDGLSTGGIDYDIDAATIRFNGQPGSENQLETGMVVEIDAEVDDVAGTGEANSIVFAYKLVGKIDEINLATNTILALGQQVRFDEFTTFKNTSSASLSVGDEILVSGFVRENGQILATYIEKSVTGLSASILEGTLSQVDAGNKTFMLADQLINYSDAQLLNIQNDVLEDGALIRVVGSEVAIVQGLPDSVIVAERVEAVSAALTGNPDAEIRIEGLISQFSETFSFRISGNTVTVDADTEYVNGAISDIAIGARIFVKGSLSTNGNIHADKVRFFRASEVFIESEIDATNLSNNTISVLGQIIVIDAFTILKDGSGADTQNYSLQNIAIGDRLKISGQSQGIGRKINAASIERVDIVGNNQQSILEGVVGDTIFRPRFSVAGLTIDTSAIQDLNGFSQGGITTITSRVFFDSLQPGMTVRVAGEFVADSLIPFQVEIVHCCNWEVYASSSGFIGGGNDVAFTWNGTLNSDVRSNNVNASISSNAEVVGSTSLVRDVRVFGPGTYVFDTGLDPSRSTNFGTTNLGGIPLQLTVKSGQIGMHALTHFGKDGAPTVCGKSDCNIDVVVLWSVNSVYEGSADNDSNLGAKGRIFNLSSVGDNGNGVPGIPVVDGPFPGVGVVYNLNFTGP